MERTQTLDPGEVLAHVLSKPPLAAQYLSEVAYQLNRTPHAPLTLDRWTLATANGIYRFLREHPLAVVGDVVANAVRVLPPLTDGDTCTTYARLLLEAADRRPPITQPSDQQPTAAVPTCPTCARTFEDCTCTGHALLVRRMLAAMARRCETNRPDEPITAIGRHALIQATTMDPVLTRALRTRAPEITGQVIRRDYAAQLRTIAGALA